MIDKDMITQLVRQAWDALEGLPCQGFSARARIQTAQEALLAIYNELNKVNPDEDPGKEGGDGDD